MYTPVTGSTVTVAPPAVVAGTLYDKVRPAGSVNAVDPVNLPVALSELIVISAPTTRAPLDDAAAGAATSEALTRPRVCTSRNTPHTTTLNASSGLPAVFEPLTPNDANTRDRKPLTGAVTDGTFGAGRLKTGTAASGKPSAGTHPEDTAAAEPATEPRDGRRSAHRGTSVAAVPVPSPPGRPPKPTRVSTLTPAATPGTAGDTGTGEEEFDDAEPAGAGPTADEPPTPEVLARSETPPATTGPRGTTAESPPEATPPVAGAAPRPPRRPGAAGRDEESVPDAEPDPDPDPSEDTVESEPPPPTGPAGSAIPTAGAKPTPTPTPNATASAPTRPTN